MCLYKRLSAWNNTEIIRIWKIESAYPCQQCKQYQKCQKCQQCKQRIKRCYPHLWRYFFLCREGWRKWWTFSPFLEPLWKMSKGQKQWGLVAQYARSHQLQLRQDEQNYKSKIKNVTKCQYIWLISFFWISGEFSLWRTPTYVNIVWSNVIMISTSKKITSLAKEAAFTCKKWLWMPESRNWDHTIQKFSILPIILAIWWIWLWFDVNISFGWPSG